MLKLREIFGISIDYILGLNDAIRDMDVTQQRELKQDKKILIQTLIKMEHIGKERVKAYIEDYLSAMKNR